MNPLRFTVSVWKRAREVNGEVCSCTLSLARCCRPGLLAGALLLSACSTVSSFGSRPAVPLDTIVKAGDVVEITKSDGRRVRFAVTTVDAASVGDATQVVRDAEISELKVARYSPTRTYWLVGGAIVGGVSLLSALDPVLELMGVR